MSATRKNIFNIPFILGTILLIGIIFSFSTLTLEFLTFYKNEGTIFKIQDCIHPNPIKTPCFYGAWGFVFAYFLNRYVNYLEDPLKKSKYLDYLMYFLLFGTAFAWYNNWSTFIDFYINKATDTFGCSGQLVTSPYATPCFIGACIFSFALLISIIRKKLR